MGRLVEGVGKIYAGNAANKAAKQEAKQLKKRAGQTRASSQRAAIESRREARYLQSAAIARAAASGGGVSDPTVANILADIQAGGEYNALSQVWEGETAAQSDEAAAKARRAEGKAARTLGYIGAVASILDEASSFGGKYG